MSIGFRIITNMLSESENKWEVITMKILFQGDSITDAGRDRDNDVNVGRGYPSKCNGA